MQVTLGRSSAPRTWLRWTVRRSRGLGARGAMLEDIDIKRRDGIAHVALNRPSVRNAVTLAMWRELADTFSRFAADRDLRAVVLTGKGKDFSVGADISEFDKIRNDRQSAEYEVAVD